MGMMWRPKQWNQEMYVELHREIRDDQMIPMTMA